MLNRLKERIADTLLAGAYILYKASATPVKSSSHSPAFSLGEPQRNGAKAHAEAVRAASLAYKANLSPAQQLDMYEKVMERQFIESSPVPLERKHLKTWQRFERIRFILSDLRRIGFSESTIERVSEALREDCSSSRGNPTSPGSSSSLTGNPPDAGQTSR